MPKKKPSTRLAARKPAIAPISGTKPTTSPNEAIKNKKSRRKAFLHYGLALANLTILGLVGYMVLIHSSNTSTSYGVHSTIAEDTSNPLDALSAADIAVNIAKMTGLPEELAVTNQAETINLYMNAAVIEREYVTKAQILSPDIKTKEDIVEYVTQEGDTVSALAAKFGVTSDSIKWSNNLSSDALTAGTKLAIPPINGIVYVAGVGDTPDKLAETYSASARDIIAFNDAEVSGINIGDRIVIPNGVKRAIPTVYKFRANYGYNGYWYGYCTWYVANKISVPNNWGNANTWDNFARVTPGWVVSATPVVGAIAQSNSGPEGHVAIVEAVSDDGSMIKYSDMNGLAGWGREGRTADWVPARARFQNFIYRAN